MCLWRATTAATLSVLCPGHVLVVAGDFGGQVQMHRWTDGIAEPDNPHQAHNTPVTAIALTGKPDGRLIALTGDRDGALHLWHIDDDLLIPTGSLLENMHRDEVTAVAFGSDATGYEVAMTADMWGGLRLWGVTDDGLVELWGWTADGDWRITAVAVARELTSRLYTLASGLQSGILSRGGARTTPCPEIG